LLGRIIGTTYGRQYYVNILKNNGVEAEAKTAEGITNEERIILLKKLLSRNTPIMIRTMTPTNPLFLIFFMLQV